MRRRIGIAVAAAAVVVAGVLIAWTATGKGTANGPGSDTGLIRVR
ncbi:hypothetical protein ABIE44_000872 [Marmoricola sp. OAE513]